MTINKSSPYVQNGKKPQHKSVSPGWMRNVTYLIYGQVHWKQCTFNMMKNDFLENTKIIKIHNIAQKKLNAKK